MSNPYRDRLLGVGFIGRRTGRARVVEGREHPDSGLPYKATTTEHGTVTEHGTPGSGVSVRQDAHVTPTIVEMEP